MSEAFEQLQQTRSAAERSVTLLVRPSLHTRRADLLRDIAAAKADEAKHGENVPVRDLRSTSLAATLDQIQAELDTEGYQTFTMVALERKDLETLRVKHRPPRDRDDLAWDPETFPPALLHASCADPVWDEQDWVTVWAVWSEGDTSALFKAAWDVNTESSVRPFSLTGSALTPASVENLTTAVAEAFPTPGT